MNIHWTMLKIKPKQFYVLPNFIHFIFPLKLLFLSWFLKNNQKLYTIWHSSQYQSHCFHKNIAIFVMCMKQPDDFSLKEFSLNCWLFLTFLRFFIHRNHFSLNCCLIFLYQGSLQFLILQLVFYIFQAETTYFLFFLQENSSW